MNAKVLPIRPITKTSGKVKQKTYRDGLTSKVQEVYRMTDFFLKRYPEHEEQLNTFILKFPFTDESVRTADVINAVYQSLPENVFTVCATTFRLTSRITNLLRGRVARQELLLEDRGKDGGSYRLNPQWGKAKTRKPRAKVAVPAVSLDPRYATQKDLGRVEAKVDQILAKL